MKSSCSSSSISAELLLRPSSSAVGGGSQLAMRRRDLARARVVRARIRSAVGGVGFLVGVGMLVWWACGGGGGGIGIIWW